MTIHRFIALVFICILNFTITYSQNSILEDLFNRGIELYDAKKYSEAVMVFEKGFSIGELKSIISSEEDIEYIKCIAVMYALSLQEINIPNTNADDGKFINSKKAYHILKEYLNPNDSTETKLITAFAFHFATQLLQNMSECVISKNYNKLDENYNQLIQIWDQYAKPENVDNIDMLIELYHLYRQEFINIAQTLFKHEMYNESTAKWKQLIDFCKKSENRGININDRSYIIDVTNYATSLINLANNYYVSENYIEAISIQRQLLDILQSISSKETAAYASALDFLSCMEYTVGNTREAVKLSFEAESICKTIRMTKDNNYARICHNISLYQYKLGQFDSATEYAKKAVNLRKQILNKLHPDYIASLCKLISCDIQIGEFEEAQRIIDELNQIDVQQINTNPVNVIDIFTTIANSYYYMGNYMECINQIEKTLEYSKKFNMGKRSEATLLHNLALYKMAIGNNEEAANYIDKALSILNESDADYPLLLNHLAVIKFDKGKGDNAKKLLNKALKIQKDALEIDTIGYAKTLHNLAYIHSELGEYTQALSLFQEALRLKSTHLNKSHPLCLSSLIGVAECLSNINKNNESIRHFKEANLIVEKAYGKEHLKYIEIMQSITEGFFRAKQISNINYHVYNTSYALNNIILKHFRDMLSNERELFWNKQNKWYQEDLNKYAFYYHTDTLNIVAYDGALFSKGLLLNSEMEIKKILLESGDSHVNLLYDEIRMRTRMLQKLYELPIADRQIDTDSLENIVSMLEKQLVKKSKAYGDYTKNLQINWRDVQNTLGDDDLAIEFCSFHLNSDSTMYIALVLNKNMSCPKTIPLFEEKQIKNIHDIYTSKDASNLVWKPLAEYINKANNVYFGSSGELHNIAIENLPHWEDNCLMSDRWNIYRLSSTRELALAENKNDIHTATVYGGIKYDTNTTILTNDFDKDRNLKIFNTADSLNLRSGVTYLPSTLTEAKDIDKTLEMNNISSTLKTDTTATEGSFKSLSGKKINLMHIATHGFYWTEKEARFNRHMDFLMIDDKHQKYVEDKALTRSGLLFAGANNALKGMELPKDVNDGILTAQEIAHLDFRGLDLVVLSACQTGLGDIKGDGVFGLQRGFKKAGANTIMMTLWKVDDKATQILMSDFYNNLTSGKSKYDSLKLAQKKLRDYSAINDNGETYYPYDSPKYWAGFILLDALK